MEKSQLKPSHVSQSINSRPEASINKVSCQLRNESYLSQLRNEVKAITNGLL